MAEPLAITVVVPTIGRPTLERTLRSFVGDLGRYDEVVVIADGDLPHIEFLCQGLAREFPTPVWTVLWEEARGNYGHPLRNAVLDRYVDTSHVWTIDDDDVATPGAIKTLRQFLTHDFVIFKMEFGPGSHANGVVCWRYKQIMHGDVGTPMIFARKSASRFGHHYSGDLDYAKGLRAIFGEPTWSEHIIALIRPEESDK